MEERCLYCCCPKHVPITSPKDNSFGGPIPRAILILLVLHADDTRFMLNTHLYMPVCERLKMACAYIVVLKAFRNRVARDRELETLDPVCSGEKCRHIRAGLSTALGFKTVNNIEESRFRSG
ncbi:hypothetical protein PoB_003186500 [Plakobranchus ocellatus]|uniref:Uncharacterized protein n=1 Tax=Plakobranchus ocellatus TaxID=259542 RepID=A0AAV4ADE7_9GAST|nr:hypothetical protein PoB_003186500 [Plakobranchus ocellatus]